MKRIGAWLLAAAPTILAVLCALGVVPWLIGVPGTENNYARGWIIGFFAIIWYLIAFAVVSLLRLAGHFRWLPIPGRMLDIAIWGAVAGFVAAQAIAWQLMLT